MLIRIAPLPIFLLAAITNYATLYLLTLLAVLLSSFKSKFSNGYAFIFALSLWSVSEFLSQFLTSQWVSTGYVAFYPFIFVAIPGIFSINQRTEIVHLIDGAVLVLGSSTVASALLLRNINADYLHIFYPLCDLVLMITVFISFTRRPVHLRSILAILGFSIYSGTDFLYLWQYSNFEYQSNSFINFGWPLAFIILAEAQHHRGISSERFPPIPIFYIALSILISALTLVAIAFRLYELPTFLIFPAFATLLASFVRMAFALRISERAVAEQQLAKVDDLTGLPNRRRFMSEIDSYFEGSLLLLDIDGFKPVNDNYGHEVGDQLLRQISKRFVKALPEEALLARLGGDEFAVLTKEGYESALELAMALRATLSYPFNIAGQQINVDVSIGCVANDGDANVMARADTAMYQAKRARVGVWTGEP